MAESEATYGFAEFEHDGARVIRAMGEFGIESSDEFRAKVNGALSHGGPVIIDLSGVEFMDSTGLSVILNALKDAWGRGQGLLVAGPLRAAIASLLAVTGVSSYVTVHPSWNAAVDALHA
jgi:anti-sigma B factor antagonist